MIVVELGSVDTGEEATGADGLATGAIEVCEVEATKVELGCVEAADGATGEAEVTTGAGAAEVVTAGAADVAESGENG